MFVHISWYILIILDTYTDIYIYIHVKIDTRACGAWLCAAQIPAFALLAATCVWGHFCSRLRSNLSGRTATHQWSRAQPGRALSKKAARPQVSLIYSVLILPWQYKIVPGQHSLLKRSEKEELYGIVSYWRFPEISSIKKQQHAMLSVIVAARFQPSPAHCSRNVGLRMATRAWASVWTQRQGCSNL